MTFPDEQEQRTFASKEEAKADVAYQNGLNDGLWGEDGGVGVWIGTPLEQHYVRGLRKGIARRRSERSEA